jgi:sialic acid synthase SpsE
MTKIIADAACNHLGNRKIMQEMIERVAKIGVDYIKFQSFHADKLNPDWPDYEKSKEYYKSVELSQDDHAFIIRTCRDNKINPLFTVFDVESAQTIRNLGVNIVKIASPDADNKELVDYCNCTFNEVIVSSGMTTSQRIRELRDMNCWVLYCISRYPATKESIDFDKMALFDGFSDHTPDIECAKKAIDMGMEYVERHYTLGKYLPGKDHLFSSTPDEFNELVDYRNYVEKCKLYKTRWSG